MFKGKRGGTSFDQKTATWLELRARVRLFTAHEAIAKSKRRSYGNPLAKVITNKRSIRLQNSLQLEGLFRRQAQKATATKLNACIITHPSARPFEDMIIAFADAFL